MTSTLDKERKAKWVKPIDWPENPKSFKRDEPQYRENSKAFENDGRERGWYKFNYVEQPGGLLTFSKGFSKPGEKKPIVEKYRMMDQDDCYIPHDIAMHLNSRQVPKPQFVKGANGFLRHVKNNYRNRFICVPTTKPVEEEM